ncbi:MAG: hypothetical protein EBV06_10435 [Planctomycetia bacterium]|nr:hypothetical protein [Planctomycetia bacterium]
MTMRRSYGWLVYFGVLSTLSGLAIVLPIIYNLGQQLSSEQLEAARSRWRENGPPDYDLTFTVRHDRDQTRQRYVVRVRSGQVLLATCEGEVLYASVPLSGAIGLPFGSAAESPPWTIERVFERLTGMLAERETTGGRNFLVAVFDPKEGYPRRFVRRIARTSTREEWDLKLWRPGELEREADRYR